ncbi:MAG: bifunctional DNA-formamidopyrimidine glycosylase/DNA-(apurinic or apyrimidinic site) lyase [Actinomycetales bacterium]|jgi:formamidopyrimidine-DNA glycosylase
MPELPEVETVRRGLAPILSGKRIKSITSLHSRLERRSENLSLASTKGARILSVERRGKYLWFTLDREQAIVGHLGMSGQMLIVPKTSPLEKHARAVIDFGDKKYEFRFVDQRTFGWLAVADLVESKSGRIPETCSHISLDPFDPLFDIKTAAKEIGKRKSEIKRVLLNQEVVSGIGNIYADEALWLAKIHPETRIEKLTNAEVIKVLNSARRVMTRALAQGGTSFDDLYINVNGESGYFEVSLRVYGREGEPCTRCRTPIQRIIFANRSSHFCPHCQKRGKSTGNRGPKSRQARG